MSSFKSAVASVQSTTGSRGVRVSGSNAGYTKFRSSVKGPGYPLHSPISPSLPLPCVTVCHHVSTGLYFRFSETSRTTAFEEICCRHLQGTPKTEAGRSFQLLAQIKLRQKKIIIRCTVLMSKRVVCIVTTNVTLIATAIVRYSSCEEQSLWVLDYEGTPSVEHLFHTHTRARARSRMHRERERERLLMTSRGNVHPLI